MNVPETPDDYSLQIHTCFGVLALIDEIIVAPVELTEIAAPKQAAAVALPESLPTGSEEFTVERPRRENRKEFRAKEFGVSTAAEDNTAALQRVIDAARGTPARLILVTTSRQNGAGNRAEQLSPGLYRMTIKDPGESMVWRFFLLFDGKQQRMEQHSKRQCGKLKKPEELKPLEWTILNRTDLYFRLPEGKTLETFRVEMPRLANGVGIYEGSEHIVIKNFIATWFWNDGFNIHHASKNISFENIAAIGCGDDSVSAHDGCVIAVKNLVAIGNGTGICHAGTAEADHENLYIADSDSRDFFMLNRRNSFRNVAVEAAAPIYSDIGDRGDAVLENLWFYSAKPGACFRTIRGGTIKAKNVKLFRHTQPGNTPGIEVVKDPAPVLAAIAKQKAELFAIFGGKLEKALADR